LFWEPPIFCCSLRKNISCAFPEHHSSVQTLDVSWHDSQQVRWCKFAAFSLQDKLVLQCHCTAGSSYWWAPHCIFYHPCCLECSQNNSSISSQLIHIWSSHPSLAIFSGLNTSPDIFLILELQGIWVKYSRDHWTGLDIQTNDFQYSCSGHSVLKENRKRCNIKLFSPKIRRGTLTKVKLKPLSVSFSLKLKFLHVD